MATRTTQLAELQNRLGDTGASIWLAATLKGYLDHAYKSLYPTFYRTKVATTTAGTGPVQDKPAAADYKRIHSIGVRRDTDVTRVRQIRRWQDGDIDAVVPKLQISGQMLVWAWTEGWDAPAGGSTTLTIPIEAEEYSIVRAQVSALENVLTDRVSAEKYFAVQVRQSITEDDVVNTLDALHVTLRAIAERQPPLPELER